MIKKTIKSIVLENYSREGTMRPKKKKFHTVTLNLGASNDLTIDFKENFYITQDHRD